MNEIPRILVIPSWYPTADNPITGCFFREQAEMLQQRYDVRVLLGFSQVVRLRTAVRKQHWFPKRGTARVCPADGGKIITPPTAIGFEYAHRSWDEAAWWEATVDAYRQMLGESIQQGWKPDVIQAHCAESAGIIACRLSREFGIPWVLTEHQIFILANYSEQRRKLMLEAIHDATQLVAVSRHQMRCILLHKIERTIAVVGNLIDEEVFRFAEPNRSAQQFRILTVTYPTLFKDPETFFRAIALLLKSGHTDIEVTVIGNNAWSDRAKANTDELERMAQKYEVMEVCRFITYAERSEMPSFYANCDVFVSTSIAETFGNAVREAMAVGRPAVCTASGGVEDDLSPINGVRVNIRDHEALAEALVAIKTGKLQFDPVKMRESIISKHGRQAFLDQMTAVYEQAMAEGRTEPAEALTSDS